MRQNRLFQYKSTMLLKQKNESTIKTNDLSLRIKGQKHLNIPEDLISTLDNQGK